MLHTTPLVTASPGYHGNWYVPATHLSAQVNSTEGRANRRPLIVDILGQGSSEHGNSDHSSSSSYSTGVSHKYNAARVKITRSWISHFYESFTLSPLSLSIADEVLHQAYRPTLKLSEMRTIRDLMDKFHAAMTQAGLTYFLCSGTLLGSYRFHGIIPWDDDVDVYVMAEEKESVRHALRSLPDDYRLVSNLEDQNRWKLFRDSRSLPIHNFTWRFPFLDISFLGSNSTHVWDEDPGFASKYMFHTASVFPLTQRPFMGLLLNAPRDARAMLARTYNIDRCKTNTYTHKREKWLPKDSITTVDCEELSSIYPFVIRSPDGSSESLEYKGKTLYTLQLDSDMTATV